MWCISINYSVKLLKFTYVCKKYKIPPTKIVFFASFELVSLFPSSLLSSSFSISATTSLFRACPSVFLHRKKKNFSICQSKQFSHFQLCINNTRLCIQCVCRRRSLVGNIGIYSHITYTSIYTRWQNKRLHTQTDGICMKTKYHTIKIKKHKRVRFSLPVLLLFTVPSNPGQMERARTCGQRGVRDGSSAGGGRLGRGEGLEC